MQNTVLGQTRSRSLCDPSSFQSYWSDTQNTERYQFCFVVTLQTLQQSSLTCKYYTICRSFQLKKKQ